MPPTKPDLATEPCCKVGIATLGCKVNRYESAALEEELQKKNFSVVPFNSIADVYIINTCTVTAFSDFQSRQLIRRAHRMNPQAKIIVTGCYAQIAPRDVAMLDGVSMVIGNSLKHQIIELMQNNADASPCVLSGDLFRQKEFCNMPLASFGDRTRAFLKIQDGCNSFCSYCIVPFARGHSRSMASEDVLSAVNKLEREGYKEIVLTGIHMGLYGHDLQPATDISRILQKMCELNLDTRIRLSSIEPNEITADLLNIIKDGELICPHLHIPLQSGDDKILQLMKRDYDTIFFRDLIEKVHSTISDIAIGVDVMVGFPSESDEQFENTFNLLECLPIAYLHVFPYSARPGTAAQKFQPQVPDKIKKERAAVLRKLSAQKREKFALRFSGKPLRVLVESTKDKKTGLLKGFSQNYLPFLLDEKFSSSINKIATVRAGKYIAGKFYG
ncbi:MAG: tRNA (N(6)-L-threonylcarbamoyladenosine(37)-C(2))-methylthiotransferase MtaB [Syntrophaceae bacterium]|nr:tRNA (N(6)-L-threonylcarbamoyladenosine(37)-C(2))-methylthiotransferase MtaB [Syntrophaceae bacterium]